MCYHHMFLWVPAQAEVGSTAIFVGPIQLNYSKF